MGDGSEASPRQRELARPPPLSSPPESEASLRGPRRPRPGEGATGAPAPAQIPAPVARPSGTLEPPGESEAQRQSEIEQIAELRSQKERLQQTVRACLSMCMHALCHMHRHQTPHYNLLSTHGRAVVAGGPTGSGPEHNDKQDLKKAGLGVLTVDANVRH